MAGLPEIAGARIGGIERELRRHQRHVLPRFGDLPRHGLTVDHVALQGGALAVQEEHDQRRPLRVVAGRQVEQRAAVAVGGLFPIDFAAQAGVPALGAVARVEERLVGVGNDAAIGEGRGVEGDELRLRLLERLRAGGRRAGGLGAAAGFLVACFVVFARAAVGISRAPRSSARRFTRSLAAPQGAASERRRRQASPRDRQRRPPGQRRAGRSSSPRSAPGRRRSPRSSH